MQVKAIFLSLLLFCSSTFASDWVLISTTNSGETHAKAGSTSKTSDGYRMIVRFTPKDPTRFPSFFVASISAMHCKQGFGIVSYSDLMGRHAFNIDYVANGGTAASGNGDILCAFIASGV